jgi:putative FmdB family regulatory protein
MPLYDFLCEKCLSKEEKLVKSSDSEVYCLNCNSVMTKQISKPSGFEFKGSGWYCSDYKHK